MPPHIPHEAAQRGQEEVAGVKEQNAQLTKIVNELVGKLNAANKTIVQQQEEIAALRSASKLRTR